MSGFLDTIRFPVTGMTCGSCVSRITRSLRRLEGVDRVHVDLGNEVVTLRRQPTVASDAVLAAAVAAAGYEAHLEAATPVAGDDTRGFLSRLFDR